MHVRVNKKAKRITKGTKFSVYNRYRIHIASGPIIFVRDPVPHYTVETINGLIFDLEDLCDIFVDSDKYFTLSGI